LIQRNNEVVEREKREREARFRESVLGGQRQRMRRRGWKGYAYEVGMDALFEVDEHEQEDQDEDMEVKVVDPLTVVGEVAVEGEEAWFEQTWTELQGDEDDDATAAAAGTVHVYPVEEDDSMYSLSSGSSSSSSSSSSRSPSPSSSGELDQDQRLDQNLDLDLVVPPPTPKLRPTKVNDKLDGPVEWGTRAAGLECGVEVGWIMERWEVLDDDEVEEGLVGYAVGADITHIAEVIEEADDSFSDMDMDVPDLVDSDADEYDERDEQQRPTALSSSSSSSSTFDEPLLVTPTEDALDDFDQGHDGDDHEEDGRDYDDDEDDDQESKVGAAEVGSKKGKEGGGGLFAIPSTRSGGLVRVIR
jgi:hypothetical protein